jgi:probable O-glycosylation ligase (exosortase A-associated)
VNPIFIAIGIIGILGLIYTFTRPYLGLLLYYFMFVFRPADLWPALVAIGIEKVAIGFVVVSYIIVSLLETQKIKIVTHPILWAIVAFYLVQVVSGVFSIDSTLSFLYTIDYGKRIIFALLIVQIINSHERFRGFIWMHIVLMAYLAVSGVIAYMTGNVIVTQGIERIKSLTSAGGDPNTLATSMDIALPFVLVLINRVKKTWLKGVLVIFAVFMVYSVILSGSRAGLLGLLTGMFLLWLYSKRKLKYAAFAIVVAYGAVLIMPDQYVARYSTIANYAEGGVVDQSTQGRYDAWEAGWQMFLDNPLLGVGAHAFGLSHSMEYSPEFQRSSLKAHSMYFQVIAELGILGVVSFLTFIYLVISFNIRIQRRLRGGGADAQWYIGLSRAIVISMIVLSITGIFGHSLYRFHWILVGVLTVVMHRITLSGKIEVPSSLVGEKSSLDVRQEGS